MRGAVDWDEDYVLQLISNGVQENAHLDYKRSEALKKNDREKVELSKDVSAFANSDGGILVYGVVEENQLPVCIDTGLDPSDITREWIEQVINTRIDRRIQGVVINQIPLHMTCPGRVIYVIEVPRSRHAPHMAGDHRYYRRFNFQSVFMEDFEVRDIANREITPDLTIGLEITSTSSRGDQPPDLDYSLAVRLSAVIRNESPNPCLYYSVSLYIDQRLRVQRGSGFRTRQKILLRVGDEEYPVVTYTKNNAAPMAMPIWEGVDFEMCDRGFGLLIPLNSEGIDYVLGWSVAAPGMVNRLDAAWLTVRGGVATIRQVNKSAQS